MSASDQFAAVVDEISEFHSARLAHPKMFTDRGSWDVPSVLAEQAQFAAAARERMGELVSQARRKLSVAEAMFSALEHDVSVEYDRALLDRSQRMIAGGSAWQERSAAANLSVLDRRVEQRGMELRLRNARALVRELEDVYEAWRQTEWAIDRQARLLGIRHSLGEV